VRTPYEKLKSLPEAARYLRPGVTMDKLDDIANQMSDNEFAERMVKARSNLLENLCRRAERVAWALPSPPPTTPQTQQEDQGKRNRISTSLGSFFD